MTEWLNVYDGNNSFTWNALRFVKAEWCRYMHHCLVINIYLTWQNENLA